MKSSRSISAFSKEKPVSDEKNQQFPYSTSHDGSYSRAAFFPETDRVENLSRRSRASTIKPMASVATVKQVKNLVCALLLKKSVEDAILQFRTYYFNLPTNEKGMLNAHCFSANSRNGFLSFEDLVRSLNTKKNTDEKVILYFIQFVYNYSHSMYIEISQHATDSELIKTIKEDSKMKEGNGKDWVFSEFDNFTDDEAMNRLIYLTKKLSEHAELSSIHKFVKKIVNILQKKEKPNYRFWFANCMVTYLYLQYEDNQSSEKGKLLKSIYDHLLDSNIVFIPKSQHKDKAATSGTEYDDYIYDQLLTEDNEACSSNQCSTSQWLRREEFDNDYFGRLHAF